ncbi:hypothetical protein LTR17_023711 [Elasticomyces elasticus]|nr:hypothetical protein LTR17_023711 [Elasticomyces elasticus]
MKTSATACPLLALPPEIRNAIWELVLVSRDPREEYDAYYIIDAGNCYVAAITQVNKQIRSETLGMFYESSRFFAGTDGCYGLADCIGWLARIGRSAVRHIRCIRVDTTRVSGVMGSAKTFDLDLGATAWSDAVLAKDIAGNSVEDSQCLEMGLEEAVRPLWVRKCEGEVDIGDWQVLFRAIHAVMDRYHGPKDQSSYSTAGCVANGTGRTCSVHGNLLRD